MAADMAAMTRRVFVILAAGAASATTAPKTAKPHVLFLLADDYGWANLGVHREADEQPGADQARAEVHTPNLDRLIGEGILLERAYAYKICSPSRSSIQSGRLAVHVNTKNVNVNHYNSTDPVSGYAGIPTNMTGLASKMKKGGYRTHFVGKWDAGMAHPLQTPLHRGYESFFGYYQHANDHWQKGMAFESTGEIDTCLNRWIDFSLYNETYKGGVNLAVSSEYGCTQDPGRFSKTSELVHGLYNATGCALDGSKCLMEDCYEEAMFLKRSLRVIDDYANEAAEKKDAEPLFLFHAFHAVHTPLQVPQSFLDKLDQLVKTSGGHPISSRQRRFYAAMVLFMDDVVGQLRARLEEKGMWENTLVIFSADNGGPIYEPAAANNYPLRGAKFNDFEGGVRVNSFVSGGHVPKANRGTKFNGILSVADWYATLSEIAGVDSFDQAAHDANGWLAEKNLPLLPAVDSVAQWQFILNGSNARTKPLHLSAQAVLDFPYKLVVGRQPYGSWQSPLYPNCTTVNTYLKDGPLVEDMQIFEAQMKLSPFSRERDHLVHAQQCGSGCLFNVEVDPGEHNDLAVDPDPASAAKLKKLQDKLKELNRHNFEPGRGKEVYKACEVQSGIGGFFGPFVDVEGFYSPVHMSPAEKKSSAELLAKLRVLDAAESRFGDTFDEIMKFVPLRTAMHNLDECRWNDDTATFDTQFV